MSRKHRQIGYPNLPPWQKGVDLPAQLRQASVLHLRGDLDAAQAIYETILKIEPMHFDALHLLGVIALQSNNPQLANTLIAKAISINPNHAAAHYNRGLALQVLELYDAAVTSYDKAVDLQVNYAKAYVNRGLALATINRFKEAVTSFDQAIGIEMGLVEAHYHRGNALQELRHFDAAIASYDTAIKINPAHADAYLNRGVALQVLKQLEAAVASYDAAIRINPRQADAHYRRGTALNELDQHENAIISYETAIAIMPDYAFAQGQCLHSKMKICDWANFDIALDVLTSDLSRNKQVTPSFPLLALCDSLPLQHKASQIWAAAKCPANAALGTIHKRPTGSKIRIGYYSADYHDHVMAYLMVELFERHDRNKFDLVAFSFGVEQDDEMCKRVATSFDQFVDVRDRSDADVALLSRELGIDIAVDLNGYTGASRSGIFSYRAAPLQVSYLGYAGTMGVEYIDYLIADAILIPKDSRQHYSEKIIYLPKCYQINGTQRKLSDKLASRADLGLPQTGFVFCCFNNNYKITPSIFGSWMRILQSVNGSVLWLFGENEIATRNLRIEAQKRGIAPERLIFAKRLPMLADHFARYRAANLFLDTLPYNGHASASDALWAGLPVLTCIGQSYVSRVAASLLTTLDMPELITNSLERYESLAIELAMNPNKLHSLNKKLERQRLTTSLFDAKLFTRHIEKGYSDIFKRYQADLAPKHIVVREDEP